MQFKRAILTVLAKRADGGATLDELKSEIAALADSFDQNISSTSRDIDIFQSKLVTADGNRLKITQHGRAALAELEARSTEAIVHTEKAKAGATVHLEPMPPHLIPTVPDFLLHDGIEQNAVTSRPKMSWRAKLSRLTSTGLQKLRAIWRKHVEPDAADVKARSKQARNVSGAAIALLSLLAILICAGTLIALTQTRSLKVEATALQRELTLLRERVARLEYERAAQELNRQRQSANKPAAEQNRAAPDSRTNQTSLNLTQEEIQIIREYIKPAPAAGTPTSAINLGDTVSIATIPLPLQLMEKIPKLQGARFTTRNGSIVILKHDSRQADAVLPP